MNNKSQEMSIQTVVVLILIMIVLVVVIAFVVPQLTGIFGGIAQLGNSTSSQMNTTVDLSSKACYPITPSPEGCTSLAVCSTKRNQADCLNVKTAAVPAVVCCTWRTV